MTNQTIHTETPNTYQRHDERKEPYEAEPL